MARATLTIILAASAVGLGGCGTMANFGGVCSERGWDPPPKVYGGVVVCARCAGECAQRVIHSSEGAEDRGWACLAAVYCVAVDLPLSAVADTLTLPTTIRVTLQQPAHLASDQPKPVPASKTLPAPATD